MLSEVFSTLHEHLRERLLDLYSVVLWSCRSDVFFRAQLKCITGSSAQHSLRPLRGMVHPDAEISRPEPYIATYSAVKTHERSSHGDCYFPVACQPIRQRVLPIYKSPAA